ncbi:MAG: rhomboid family intramembrane serine protease [Candidatus Poseidoniales archaeon]|nr:MAG: rhomboid family intramembrane serine protease [Candidatus Poseidoniales archaeon]
MEEVLFGLWIVAIIGPLAWSWYHKASIAMAMTLSLLFGYIVQLIWGWTLDYHDLRGMYDMLWMRPSEVEGGQIHTLITSGFIHSPWDPLHVLGNIIIIALVGIPLEDRLGRGRWLTSYMIGLLGGSIAWTIANNGSYTPALGASGAAFGILGAYLCGWPEDEVYFPLILIRKWPVQLIALFYFGFEIFKAWQVYGLSQVSHVAHIAHFGGFILAYAALPLLKRGIEWEGEVELTEITQENPFEGVDELVKRLREEGDEKETRQAWLEEIAERASCPVCGSNLQLKKMRIRCDSNKFHVLWP